MKLIVFLQLIVIVIPTTTGASKASSSSTPAGSGSIVGDNYSCPRIYRCHSTEHPKGIVIEDELRRFQITFSRRYEEFGSGGAKSLLEIKCLRNDSIVESDAFPSVNFDPAETVLRVSQCRRLGVEEVKRKCFRSGTALRELLLDHADGVESFTRLWPDIRTLKVENTPLSARDISTLRNLIVFELTADDLRLPAEFFANNKALKAVKLSGKSSTLPEGLLFRLLKLESVHFDSGVTFHHKIFKNRNSLRNVSLTNLNLDELTEDTFKDLISLEVLNLTENKLASLPEGIFVHTTLLKVLDLSKNRFQALTKSKGFLKKLFSKGPSIKNPFLPLRNLEILNLEQNQVHFEGLSAALSSLPRLRRLNLRSNQLNFTQPAIENPFATLKFLTHLDLSRNPLESLPLSWFQHSKFLRELKADQSNLLELNLDDLPLINASEEQIFYLIASGISIREDEDLTQTLWDYFEYDLNGRPVKDIFTFRLADMVAKEIKISVRQNDALRLTHSNRLVARVAMLDTKYIPVRIETSTFSTEICQLLEKADAKFKRTVKVNQCEGINI